MSVTGKRDRDPDGDGQEHTYRLRKYNRSNQSTCIDQRPIVNKGDHVEPGDVIADSSSTDDGELALGQNVLCAFMSWEGGNYEDAILISEELVRAGQVHLDPHRKARDRGPRHQAGAGRDHARYPERG